MAKRMAALRGSDLSSAVAAIDGWAVEPGDGGLTKRFRFPDFQSAFAFMTAVALEAERMNHHPEWTNVYATVDVRLSSHDVGGVTERDLALARHMNTVAARLAAAD